MASSTDTSVAPTQRGAALFWNAMVMAHWPAMAMVLALVAIDLAGNAWTGLRFIEWGRPLGVALFLALLSAVYTIVRPRPALAELGWFGALWTVFTLAGVILTYLGAATALPLADSHIADADAMLGFDWPAWVAFVQARPALEGVLHLFYDTLLLQIVGSIILFALLRRPDRNQELLVATGVALMLTVIIAALLPTLGPMVHFGHVAVPAGDALYVGDLRALRSGTLPPQRVVDMNGIISFPSFHTVYALLFTYAHRGIRWTFPVIAAANVVMIAAIPSEGFHYLSDVLAGAAVAAATIAIMRLFARR